MRSIYENGKEKLYIFKFTGDLYIYLSTTTTLLHGKTSLHIIFHCPYSQGTVLPECNCLILNLSLLCLTAVCFTVNSLIHKYLTF